MASAESKRLDEIMELIQDGCSMFDKLVKDTHESVKGVKNSSNEIYEYAGDAQEDDLVQVDIDDIIEGFKDAVEKMEKHKKKVDTVQERFRAAKAKLQTAQTQATGSAARSVDEAFSSAQNAQLCYGGSGLLAYAGMATAATGGLALPFVFLGASLFGMAAGRSCEIGTVKNLTWAAVFQDVGRKLDMVYSIVTRQTSLMSRALSDVSIRSETILFKVRRVARRTPSRRRTGFFRRKCIQLQEECSQLKGTCIEYIEKSDASITGSMAQLSIGD